MPRLLYLKQFSALLWVVTALLALASLTTVWQINQWSLQYLTHRLDSSLLMVTMAEPPMEHPHAKIWMAKDTFDNGETIQAEKLLASVAETQNIFVLHHWGYIHLRQEHYDEAIAAWTDSKDYESLLKLKQTGKDVGNNLFVDKAYQGLLQIQPQEIVWPYAEFLAHSMDEYGAAEILRDSIQKYPKKAADWEYNLGNLLTEQGEWEEAKTAYMTTLSLEPENYWTMLQLGITSFNNGDGSDQSIAWFSKAIEIEPELGNAYFHTGLILTSEGRYSEADSWYLKAMQLSPNDRWIWLSWANNSQKAGNYIEAEDRYLQTIEQFPDWAPVYNELAWNFKINNQPLDAMQMIEQAISLLQQPDGGYYFRAGLIYEMNGLNSKAYETYTFVLELVPEHEGASGALERLRLLVDE